MVASPQFLLIFALVVSTASAGAQQVPASRPASPAGTVLGVSVTEAQLTQVLAMDQQTRTALRAILLRHGQGVAIDSADRHELRAIAERHNATILALLTPDQRVKAEAYLSAHRAQPRTGHRARAAVPGRKP